jgi:hypothetical protein
MILIIVFSPISHANSSLNFGEPNNSVMDNPNRFRDETNAAVDRNLKKEQNHHQNAQDLHHPQRSTQERKEAQMRKNAEDIQQNLDDEQNKMNAEHH